MQKPDGCIEIFIQPGEYYWGDRYTRIRTILGSCVTLTAWHPRFLVGGMTHIMLAEKSPQKQSKPQVELDGKYAEDAIQLLLKDIQNHGAKVQEYQFKLFGGGNMFAEQKDKANLNRQAPIAIGEKNIEAVRALVKLHKINLHAEHIGGVGHRSVIFDIWSGYSWVKHAK